MKKMRRPGGSIQRRPHKGTKAMFANYLAIAPEVPGDTFIPSAEDLERWFREEQAFRWERSWRE